LEARSVSHRAGLFCAHTSKTGAELDFSGVSDPSVIVVTSVRPESHDDRKAWYRYAFRLLSPLRTSWSPAGFGRAVTAPQCVRQRKDGRRCEARAADWGVPDPTGLAANPVACWAHLTPAERTTCRANRDRRAPRPQDHAAPAPLPWRQAAPLPWPPRRSTPKITTSHSLRKSLNKAAFLLATDSGRHPGAVNSELNGVMGVERRAEASKEQLREGLRYVGDQLRALGRSRTTPRDRDAGTTFGGDPPF